MSTTDMFLQSALKLGLSGKAASVYVFLLKAKKSVAPVKIVNSTKLHRQYVYDALHELQQKELIESTGHGRGVKYFAHTPNKALSSFEEKRLDAMEGINHLMSLYQKNPQGLVEIIEGNEAVVASELKIMEEQKIGTWLDIVGGAGKGFLDVFGERFEEYEKLRRKMQCKVRYIGTQVDVKYNKESKIEHRFEYEVKYLENIDNIVNICVRPDSVSFNMYSPEAIVIRIKNPETIISQRALFDILWNVAKSENFSNEN